MENFSLLSYEQFVTLVTKALPFSLVVTALVLFAYLIFFADKKYRYGKKEKLQKSFSLALLTLICSLITWLTVLSRIGGSYQPFSNIFGGWFFLLNQDYFDSFAIQNVIMFIPFSVSLVIFKKAFADADLSDKGIITASLSASFLFSVVIELSQGMFSIGLFQISDIFYNTLGGALGGLIYIAAIKIKNSVSK